MNNYFLMITIAMFLNFAIQIIPATERINHLSQGLFSQRMLQYQIIHAIQTNDLKKIQELFNEKKLSKEIYGIRLSDHAKHNNCSAEIINLIENAYDANSINHSPTPQKT